MNPTLRRRDVLKMLAASGALGSLPVLSTGRLFANPEAVPLRIVFFHYASGILRDEWIPKGSPGKGSAWELADVMKPLQKYKSRITIFKDLDMVSALHDKTAAGNAHIAGGTHYMTGYRRLPGFSSLSDGLSADQWIAHRLNHTWDEATKRFLPAPITRLPSIEIAASGDPGGGVHSASSWVGRGNSLRYLIKPNEIYGRLYGSLGGMDGVAKGEDAMGFLRSRHDRLMGKLSREDREFLQHHMELRESMHQRFGVRGPRDERAMAQAEFDALLARWQGPTSVHPNDRTPEQKAAIWHATTDANIELAAAALYSDATRVLSFGLETPPDHVFGFTSGTHGANDWHGLDHDVSDPTPQAKYAQGTPAYNVIREMQRQQIVKLARFLDTLEALRETDGKTLLEHTVVVTVSHISNGSHQLDKLPWVVVGDAHGALKTDQYLDLGRHSLHPDRPNESTGRAHNDLFVTLGQAMGIKESSFGLEKVCQGPIKELLV